MMQREHSDFVKATRAWTRALVGCVFIISASICIYGYTVPETPKTLLDSLYYCSSSEPARTSVFCNELLKQIKDKVQ